MTLDQRIEQVLRGGLKPLRLEVHNESHLHKGHRGDDGSGESHYRLIIVSSAFEGLSRVQRHRLVNDLLEKELKNIHALSLETFSPEEKKQTKK